MVVQPKLLATFLSDLDVVCPKPNDLSLSVSFVTDLEAAYKHALASTPQVPVISVADLATLGEQLETWRTTQLRQLKSLLEKLPEDDPLRSPVSLFGTMDYGRLETAHTRALAWLLGKGKREHGFDFQLLEALLRHLLNGRQIRLSRASEIMVESEHSAGGGRIDIFAKGFWEEDGHEASWRLVIEAKIDAKESEEQLLLYDAWLEKHPVANTLRVLLTPHEKRRTNSTDWQTLTFVELASVLRRVPGLQDRPGYHFLRYYLTGVLRDVCKMSFDTSSDCTNPYATVDYLKAVLDAGIQEDSHGLPR